MGRKKKRRRKREVDELLLDSIFSIEHEWKQIKSIVSKSIDSSINGRSTEKIAQAKYLFLLREAKHRKISAVRYSK
ncbi:YaaL family protein [Ornithinibacillus contaminans]|uniref:YaaL family protein n=1 Tax=Ornithinibacillus contaminans TaxID=694055 RepID=UPI00064DFEDD|nr:YaaL family protein [Ornithinibacillus contaminans]